MSPRDISPPHWLHGSLPALGCRPQAKPLQKFQCTFHRDPWPEEGNSLSCHDDTLRCPIDGLPLHGSSLQYFEISLKPRWSQVLSALCTKRITAWIRATSAKMPTVFIYIEFIFPKEDGDDDIPIEGGMKGGDGFGQPIMSQSDHLFKSSLCRWTSVAMIVRVMLMRPN